MVPLETNIKRENVEKRKVATVLKGKKLQFFKKFENGQKHGQNN
jgi:hypothetical protein